jgi:uncharacterized protein YbjT (DUF2867 family)
MIVVTGATGNVGGEVVAQLVARGVATRAIVRSPSSADLPGDTDVRRGDLGEPGTLRASLAGAEAVFLVPGFPGAAAAVADAGVRRIVLLSGGSAGSGDRANAVTRMMADTEAEVRETGLEYTVLRPTAFMSNALRWAGRLGTSAVVKLPFADIPLACVHPADIAAVAVEALVTDGHDRMIYRPTGPEALLPAEQVRIVAEVLQSTVQFEPQSNDEARRSMLADGTPPEYVAAFLDFAVNGSIDESTVRSTVQDVTGRAPRTFRQWVTENVTRFG